MLPKVQNNLVDCDLGTFGILLRLVLELGHHPCSMAHGLLSYEILYILKLRFYYGYFIKNCAHLSTKCLTFDRRECLGALPVQSIGQLHLDFLSHQIY